MPRVYLTNNEKLNTKLAEWVYGKMRANRITQQDIADRRGISRQAVSKKLISRSFDFEDFVCFVEMFKPDDVELRKLVGG